MKILGLFDIISSFLLFLLAFKVVLPFWLLLIFSLYLVVKGLIFIFFSADVGSLIDVAGGAIMFGSQYTEMTVSLFVVFGLIFLIKGGFSLA